ncbi:NAD(P)H-dependent oxidoreductase [Algibacter sp. Ld11]|uniref:NAD(P)H-dependent oxidoreductase n=1 Tax=Algibacter sp. Ld11 TaxID=649150 RepID=UPI00386BC05D
MELINNLNWRYAVKQFDPSKKVSNEDIELIKEAIRLSPSSFGLQPYKVFIIENEALKEKLKPAAWGQAQITDASHLFVFCSYQDLKEIHVDELFELKSKAYNKDISELESYVSFIKGSVAKKLPEIRRVWNSRQAYIGLSNLVNACAELKIDACPMEGFDPNAVGELLDLDSKGLDAVVLAAVGYRSSEDKNQHFPKVRKSKETLFESI